NAGDAGIPVCRIADEREIIRDVRWSHAELRAHGVGVANLSALAIDLHDAIADDGLREILVGGPDAHLLDALVLRREVRRRCQRVVGLEVHHRPNDDTHRRERLLERMKLRPQRRLDALTGLVSGIEVVAKRLDDVIGGDADVCGAAFEHLDDGSEHSRDSAERRVAALEPSYAIEMAKELVRAVNEMNDHAPINEPWR